MGITILTPADHNLPLELEEDYLYRGYIIRRDREGFNVYDPNKPTEVADDGWGITLLDAMLVINEIVDGEPRRKIY